MSVILLSLPDGSKKECKSGVTFAEVAKFISLSLYKKAIVAKKNGKLYDLCTELKENAEVEIVTVDSEEGVDVIRHDAAHLLAQALKELYPEIKFSIGPTIKYGFYYDIQLDKSITEEDFPIIEKKMRELSKKAIPIKRKLMEKDKAIEYFDNIGEKLKVEILKGLPEKEEISFYQQGEFIDLCRGPHAPSTNYVKHFKLMKVSGSYFKGDSQGIKLQRIYGIAFATKEEVSEHLEYLEEIKKRDHRVIAKDMNLLHFQPEAPGSVFWHPNGWFIHRTLIEYMREKQEAAGYVEINTPELMDYSIWETSGHADKFKDSMFTAYAGDDSRKYAIKPMSCPGGVQVFKNNIVSYKDLPMKLSEFGKVIRYEPTGALHGLLRVRAFTQDDSHVFCLESDLKEECIKLCTFIIQVYSDFGFNKVKLKFADRPDKRIGSDIVWDKLEGGLLGAAKSTGLQYSINRGEGAFYGPKIEFVLTDVAGREWQMGTIQVDLNLPVRFGMYYTDKDGSKKHPVMIHRAVLGSIERFIGILLEEYIGRLPLWLSPVEVGVLTVTNAVDKYADKLIKIFKKNLLEYF